MKSIILIILIWELNIFPSFAHSTNPLNCGTKVTVFIEFGGSPYCTGFGLCRLGLQFDGSGKGGGAMGPGLMGHIQINNTNSGFDLDFTKNELLKYQSDKLIFLEGKSEVTFNETFQLSNDIRIAIGSQRDLVIRPGTYPLTFIDGIFTIKLPY